MLLVLKLSHSPATSTANSRLDLLPPITLCSPQTSHASVSGGFVSTAMDLFRLTATLL